MNTGKIALLIIPVLLIAGCVEEGTDVVPPFQQGQQQQERPQVLDSPEAAAKDFSARTYFNTDYSTYSDFTYATKYIDDATAEVTIRFKLLVNAPSYTLTRTMEQIVGTEKRGDAWLVTDTPNARIVSESYER